MAATAGFLNKVLDLYFDNITHTEIGDAAGLLKSVGDGSFYISLHTADPVAGSQATNESAVGTYARKAVSRTNGFTVAGANVSNAAAVTFAQGSSGSETITHFGIGEELSADGTLFMAGALDTNRSYGTGITLEFGIGELDVDLT